MRILVIALVLAISPISFAKQHLNRDITVERITYYSPYGRHMTLQNWCRNHKSACRHYFRYHQGELFPLRPAYEVEYFYR